MALKGPLPEALVRATSWPDGLCLCLARKQDAPLLCSRREKRVRAKRHGQHRGQGPVGGFLLRKPLIVSWGAFQHPLRASSPRRSRSALVEGVRALPPLWAVTVPASFLTVPRDLEAFCCSAAYGCLGKKKMSQKCPGGPKGLPQDRPRCGFPTHLASCSSSTKPTPTLK